eukprot:jgi/Phyca11/14420/fgenesh1_pg.PHYCAscaffold_7_\
MECLIGFAPQFTGGLLSPGLRVGYTDEGGVWQFLAPSLSQRLPLRSIEWRNLVGVTKRIDQLPLHFVEISVENVENDLPLACVYLVKCEDLDSYKSVVRPPLMAWTDAMTAAKVEWLILYVPLGTRLKAAGNTQNPVYRKIFDRLRADFTYRKAKEKLALMYQQMYLQDDAIRHLDELDAIFGNLNEIEKQAFQDGSKVSFSRLEPIFTLSPLALDLTKTQQLIASNRASARLLAQEEQVGVSKEEMAELMIALVASLEHSGAEGGAVSAEATEC